MSFGLITISSSSYSYKLGINNKRIPTQLHSISSSFSQLIMEKSTPLQQNNFIWNTMTELNQIILMIINATYSCINYNNNNITTIQLIRCVRGEYKVHSGDAKVYVQKSEQVRNKTKITFTQHHSQHHTKYSSCKIFFFLTIY